MLRALVATLVVLNLVFFAWTTGWLDSVVGARAMGDREPERMAQQVSADIVRILPASAAGSSAASSSTDATSASNQTTCLEAGPYTDSTVSAAQAAMLASVPNVTWNAVKTDQPAVWTIYMGKFANREALAKKEEELKRRKVEYEELLDNPAFALGLALGKYDDRAAANKAMEQLAQQGIHTGRATELRPSSTAQFLRVEKADPDVTTKLTAIRSDALGKGFAPCAKVATN